MSLPVESERKRLRNLVAVNSVTGACVSAASDCLLSETGARCEEVTRAVTNAMMRKGRRKCFAGKGILIKATGPRVLGTCVRPSSLVVVKSERRSRLRTVTRGIDYVVINVKVRIDRGIVGLTRRERVMVVVSPCSAFAVTELVGRDVPMQCVVGASGLIAFGARSFASSVRGRVVGRHRHTFPMVGGGKGYVKAVSQEGFLSVREGGMTLISRGRGSRTISGVSGTRVIRVVSRRGLNSLRAVMPVSFEGRPIKYATAVLCRVCKRRGLRVSPDVTKLLYTTVVSSALVFHSPAYALSSGVTTNTLTLVTKVGVRRFTGRVFGTKDGLGSGSPRRVFCRSCGGFVTRSRVGFNIKRVDSVSDSRLTRVGRHLIPFVIDRYNHRNIAHMFFVLAGVVRRSARLLCCNRKDRRVTHVTFRVRPGSNMFSLGNIISHGGRLVPTLVRTTRTKRGSCG